MAVVAAAVVGGLAALLGTGISVYGSYSAGEAEEERQKKAEALNAQQFKEQIQAQRREQNMKGLEFLGQQRDKANIYSKTKIYDSSFKRDLRRAMGGE